MPELAQTRRSIDDRRGQGASGSGCGEVATLRGYDRNTQSNKAALSAAALLAFICTAAARPAFEPQPLTQEGERAWIDAVKTHQTGDGATVVEVLKYVEGMRPDEIKFGGFSVGYNGATGLPDDVSIAYWIGKNRAPDDAYVNLFYSITEASHSIQMHPAKWPLSQALEQGRETFLAAVDEAYSAECVDSFSHIMSC